MSVYQKIDVLTGLSMLKDLATRHPNKLKQDYGICHNLNLICSGGKMSYEYGLVISLKGGNIIADMHDTLYKKMKIVVSGKVRI